MILTQRVVANRSKLLVISHEAEQLVQAQGLEQGGSNVGGRGWWYTD